jgi:hypothetical protein
VCWRGRGWREGLGSGDGTVLVETSSGGASESESESEEPECESDESERSEVQAGPMAGMVVAASVVVMGLRIEGESVMRVSGLAAEEADIAAVWFVVVVGSVEGSNVVGGGTVEAEPVDGAAEDSSGISASVLVDCCASKAFIRSSSSFCF